MGRHIDPKTRFMKFVAMSDGCWLWTGRIIRGYGHGQFSWCGRSAVASRVAWELFMGEEPGELLVCHHCDNPRCVNPAHLFLGTAADNSADMIKKGRGKQPKLPRDGERNGRARLTWSQVDAIRRKLRTHTQRSLAAEYGVSSATISGIASGRRWAKPSGVAA